MTDELELRLRDGLTRASLPAAPESLLATLDRLEAEPRLSRRVGGRGFVAVVAAAIVLVAGTAAFVASRGQDSSVGPSMSPGPSPTASPDNTARPSAFVMPPDALTVGEAIARRDAGELGSTPIHLVGYWTSRAIGHSCAPPTSEPGELEIYCGDGEFGITELNEPILEYTADYRAIPTTGPHLTPWISDDLLRPFAPDIVDFGMPPVPIVVLGHFDDPRAAECRPQAQDLCRQRFVIDEILSFDPSSVPAPTPTPTPSPFPSPPPAALFGAGACDGDVPYSFVGWTTPAEIGLPADSHSGHIFAMVTKDLVPISDWATDKASGQQFRLLARHICYTEDIYAGYEFGTAPITFGVVPGTLNKEWEDGRIEPTDSV